MGHPPSANVFHMRPLGALVLGSLAAILLAAAPAGAASVLRASGASLGAGSNEAGLATVVKAGPPGQTQTMSYLIKTLNKFKDFAVGSQQGVEGRHKAEELRLQAAVEAAEDPSVKLALTQSAASNKEALRETQQVYQSMVEFSDSMIKVMQSATSKGASCDELVCGNYASCSVTTTGAACVCNEGYIGQGTNCHAPPEFMPHRLLNEGSLAPATQAADLHVSVLEGNKIAIVFRDVTKGDVGRVLVGNVREAGLVDLSPPEQFTVPGGRAFSPVVAGTSEDRFAIAWRDENRMGTCWLRGAAMGVSGIAGAEMAITWGKPLNFCSEQAHKMSIIGFPDRRVMVLFSDKVKATPHTPVESFGNSILAQIGPQGSAELRGQFRFFDYAVTRLEAVKLTPTSFVLAARAAKAVDDIDPKVSTRQEAMAMYGELVDGDLVFDPNPVNLEPQKAQMWARGVSLIAPNTLAYAYQDGTDLQMKMAVLEVDPISHRLQVAQSPITIRSGFSPYVSMLSVPYSSSDPHTLTYYEGSANSSMVNLCSWDAASKQVSRCEDFMWMMDSLRSVSGVHLGGGKSFMVFTTESNVPYYSVFGLSKA